jgi:hypothetical protein
VPYAEEAAEQSRAAFDPVDTRATEGRLRVPELTVSSDQRRIVRLQQGAAGCHRSGRASQGPCSGGGLRQEPLVRADGRSWSELPRGIEALTYPKCQANTGPANIVLRDLL